MAVEFGFRFGTEYVNPRYFGPTYIDEFQRVLRTYAASGTANILEWGSGLTTQVLARHAESLPAVELLLTIDSNADYQKAIFADRVRPPFLKEVALDTIGPRNCGADPELAYSTYPLSLGRKFDFIFIDGRRRMECAFIATLLSHSKTVVALHDYRRGRYQPILALYDVIEDGAEFRVLRPRPSILAVTGEGIARVEAGIRGSAGA